MQLDFTSPQTVLDSSVEMHKAGDRLIKDGKTEEGYSLLKEAERGYNGCLNRGFRSGMVLTLLGAMDQRRGNNGRAIALGQVAVASLINLYEETKSPVLIKWLVDAHSTIAFAYRSEGEREKAENHFEEALKWGGENAETLSGFAGLYINEGKPEKCIELIRKAKKLAPDDKENYWNLGLAQLELGRWKDGFANYHKGVLGKERLDLNYWTEGKTPQWDGSPDKTVVIYGEQGVGDEVMGASMIPDAIQDCKHVIFDCHPRLEKLFKRSFPGIEIHGTRKIDKWGWAEDHNDIDACIPILSLGMYYRRKDTDFPRYTSGYLRADQARVAHYRKMMKALGPGPYIGIAWAGGTKKTRTDIRSIDLSLWEPILEQNARFISIQYMPTAHQIAEKYGLPHWQDAIDDLDEQAALIKACDLIITVNQSLVHCGGALAQKTWVLTPSKPAWRYGLKGTRMIWYPTVKQYRQKDGEHWNGTIERLSNDLKGFIRSCNVRRDSGARVEPARRKAGSGD